MQKISTKQLVFDAMLCALCAVLGYVALDLTVVKITFESFPILLAALLFGPIDGAIVGAVGTFIYQSLKYGFSYTTVLWMLPYILCGLFVGLYAARKNFKLTEKQHGICIVLAELMITVLNTGVIYLDSIIFNYYYSGIILGSLGIRIIVCLVKAVIFAAALYPLAKIIRKNVLYRN